MEVIDHVYYASVPDVSDNDRKKMLEDLRTQVRIKLLSL